MRKTWFDYFKRELMTWVIFSALDRYEIFING